jgi:hypothetical protein
LTYIHNNFGLEGEKENAFLINYCEVFGSILEGMMSAAAAKKAEWCASHCPHKAFGKCPSGCTYRYYSYKGKPTPIEELSFDGLCQYFGNFFEKEIGPVIADIRQKRNATHLSKKQATLDAFVAKNLFKMSKRALLDSLLSSLTHYWEKQGAICLSYPNEVKHG